MLSELVLTSSRLSCLRIIPNVLRPDSVNLFLEQPQQLRQLWDGCRSGIDVISRKETEE